MPKKVSIAHGSGSFSSLASRSLTKKWDAGQEFAFVIGMTSQVSDVTVKSKVLRRTVTAHGLLSFVFNLTVLALAVNLAASSIGNLSGL
jgi:uncharacterized membrane protein